MVTHLTLDDGSGTEQPEARGLANVGSTTC
jgi:hypothetical protein